MFRPIILTNSSSGAVPHPANLEVGELAFNSADNKLFTKNASGSIVVLNSRNPITGSYSLIAISSSFAQTASFARNSISSSFAQTASFALNAASGTSISSSWASSSISSSFAQRAIVFPFTGSAILSGSTTITGSLFGQSATLSSLTASVANITRVSSDLLPSISSTYNIGADVLPFSNIYFSNISYGRSYTAMNGSVTGAYAADNSNNRLVLGTSTNHIVGLVTNNSIAWIVSASANSAFYPNTDNASDLGTVSRKVRTVWATNISSSAPIPSASYAISASFSGRATTASYALNGGSSGASFPYTGSAGISGSLEVNGDIVSSAPTAVIQVQSPTVTANIRTTGTDARVGTATNHDFALFQNNAVAWYIDTNKNFLPNITNTYELGATGQRVKTIWTNAISSSLPIASASYALNASSANTASFALSTGATFPFTGSAIITGSLTVHGTITAQEFNTEFVSASIIFQSGSTLFGNSADDTHRFTGSVVVDGPLLFATNNIYDIGIGATRVRNIWTTSISSSLPIASASYAVSASYAPSTPSVSSSYAATASLATAISVVTASNALTASLSTSAANSYLLGPSVTLGVGVWLVTSTVTVLQNSTTNSTIFAKISTTGATNYASTQGYMNTINTGLSLSLSTIINRTTSTLIGTYVASSGADSATLTIIASQSANASGNTASTIHAVKIG